jgi:DNA invertase Pin-like site-specific DNA recombinase
MFSHRPERSRGTAWFAKEGSGVSRHHRLLLEPATDTRPVAYGYVRLDEPDHEAVSQFRRSIAVRCGQGDFRLANTFCDLGSDGSTLARPALADLLEVLKTAPGATVVVPDLTHLSPYESIRSVLLLLLHRAEHQLLAVKETNGKHDDADMAAHRIGIADQTGGTP